MMKSRIIININFNFTFKDVIEDSLEIDKSFHYDN